MAEGITATQNLAEKLTVIIPAYNEAEAVGGVVAELIRRLPKVAVLVIDDGSRDDTAGVAQAAGAKVIRHHRNRGYGASLKTGIRAAQTEFLATCDADAQHRPEDLERLLQCAPDNDMVIGARDSASHQRLSRRPGKWLLSRFAQTLVGQKIPDLNSGLRVMRRDIILRYAHLLPNGFSASTTMTVCFLQRGWEVEFVPITAHKRIGKSTVRQLRDGVGTMSLIVRLIVLFNPRRFFVPPALVLIAAGIVYGAIKALLDHRGIPVLAELSAITGLIMGMFGLLAEQISTLRLELFEKDKS